MSPDVPVLSRRPCTRPYAKPSYCGFNDLDIISAELYKEYQKQKAKLQQEMEDQEKKHIMYQQQLMDVEHKSDEHNDNRYIENHGSPSSPSFKTNKYSDVMNDTPSKLHWLLMLLVF